MSENIITEMELQQQNIKGLLELVQQNPALRIFPLVDTECVPSDDYNSWVAGWGEASIEEICTSIKEEMVYVKSDAYESLVDKEYDKFFGTDIDDLTAMKLAREKVDAYDWKKVIVVQITAL